MHDIQASIQQIVKENEDKRQKFMVDLERDREDELKSIRNQVLDQKLSRIAELEAQGHLYSNSRSSLVFYL
jgi:hypothetical protein